MSDVLRLMLLSHAMTDALAAGRFPVDEPLNAMGRRQADGKVDVGRPGAGVFAGPERRCLQTAELLGLEPVAESRLADLDCGSWRGADLGGVPPADLAMWLLDPARAPHGGESLVDLLGRVQGWMTDLADGVDRPESGRIVAVTHPAVIRAAILVALAAPPNSFWRIDITPVSRTVLHFRGRHWMLRSGPSA